MAQNMSQLFFRNGAELTGPIIPDSGCGSQSLPQVIFGATRICGQGRDVTEFAGHGRWSDTGGAHNTRLQPCLTGPKARSLDATNMKGSGKAMQDLGGRIAFVTGGSSGIGLGLVKVLAAAGMKVAFTYRQAQHRDEALAHLRQGPGLKVHAIALDVTDRAGFKAAADEAERVFGGPVQVLINNAGVGLLGLMEQASYADLDWVLSVNVGGVINGVQTFLPRMLAAGLPGHIVNVASIGGLAALGSAGLYATSKFAVVGLSEALRTDLLGRPIGVSVYCPGLVKSNIGDSARSRPASLAESGYAAPDPDQGEPPPQFMRHAMDAETAAGYVLDGIRHNRLFILSHPEFREVLTARSELLLGSIPQEPLNEARANSERWLLSNPVYNQKA
jgi:NAD(P)-dependent dehydrogenase (short-subunit alcohol dehydrogenase family)